MAPTFTTARSVSGMPRELAGQMMKSRNVPVKRQLVMFLVLLPNSTGWTPPIGSTICSVRVAAAGFPPAVRAVIVYSQWTPIFGVIPGSVIAILAEGVPASRVPESANAAAAVANVIGSLPGRCVPHVDDEPPSRLAPAAVILALVGCLRRACS